MFLNIYKYISLLLTPVILLYFTARLLAGKESRTRWRERLAMQKFQRPKGKLIWFHAASVGEAISVQPLIIEALASTKATIVITTGTVTAMRLIETKFPDRVINLFVPLDLPWAARLFMRKVRPDAGVFVESELWPNVITSAQNSGCRLILINARMSDRSFRRWKLIPASARLLLGKFSTIIPQSQTDKDRLEFLTASRLENPANIKYAAAPLEADITELNRLHDSTSGRTLWLAASTHEGEEEIILRAHHCLKQKFPDLLTIIAPRHPIRAQEIKTLTQLDYPKLCTRSKHQDLTMDTEIYLADTIGELGIFYRLSPVSFIGGSLIPRGGHNPIEPASLMSVIITGGYTHNFAEVYADFASRKAATVVSSEAELVEAVTILLSDTARRDTLTANAHALVSSKNEELKAVSAGILSCL